MKDCKLPSKIVCSRCDRPGHLKKDCPARLIHPPEDSTAAVASTRSSDGEAQGLIAHALTGVANDSGDKAEGTLSAVEEWVGDTGAVHHMTDSLRYMRNVQKCSLKINGIGEKVCEASLKGTVPVVFVTGEDEFAVDLHDVMYVPNLGYNLFATKVEFDGETWDRIGGPEGVMTAFDGKVTFTSSDGLLVATAFRVEDSQNAFALPAIAPSNPPVLSKVDVNDFHCIYGHAGEHLLKMTASRLGVELEGSMQPCTGCSMAKGFRKGIPHSTKSRSDRKLGRVFVDLSGKKSLASIGGMQYVMIVKDEFSRYTWLYYLRNKSDAASAFKRFLTDVRADGVPSEVQIVRSDDGGEFSGGSSGRFVLTS